MSGTLVECDMTNHNTSAAHCEEIFQGRSLTPFGKFYSFSCNIHLRPMIEYQGDQMVAQGYRKSILDAKHHCRDSIHAHSITFSSGHTHASALATPISLASANQNHWYLQP